MQFLSVAARDNVAAMREFVERHELDGLFPHIADTGQEVWSRFGVAGQPAWVFVDDSGEATRHLGALTEDELEAIIDDLAS